METAFFSAVQSLTGNPGLDSLMVLLAEYLVVAVPLYLIYLWFQDAEKSLELFGATLTGIAASYTLSLIYSHPSPFMLYDTIASGTAENGFPSQHATVLFSMALAARYRKLKTAGLAFTILALITGFARIYIGEHFLIDILGSLIAASVGLAVLVVLDRSSYSLRPLADRLKQLEAFLGLDRPRPENS